MCKKCSQNVRSRVGCAKSALYSTKCTLESGMCKKCSIQHKCMLESGMCKKCSIQHKMYAREWDVQKVLYTAQNVCSRVGCAKSALYSTKCTLESGMCKKCSIQHKCMLESGMCKKCSIQHKMYAVVIRIIILKEVGLEGGRERAIIH